MKKSFFKKLALGITAMLCTLTGFAQSEIVFKNVRIFDGENIKLSESTEVLIVDNMVKTISPSAGESASANAKVIDGNGKVLLPGLSDTHTHIMFNTLPQMQLIAGDPNYNTIYASKDAEAMLMRGITTIRDMSGNSFGLKKAIDQGLEAGPRIYPSGGMLSQTGGHGDFRLPNQTHPQFGGNIEPLYKQAQGYLVDGVPEVLAAARDNLRNGASHIKLSTGGGYSSPSDPLMGIQFTYEEVKAAVDAATNWGTYVTIHSYFDESVNMCIDAGIKDVGHGQLLSKKTLERMAAEGVVLSTQPFTVCNEPQLDEFSNSKLAIVCEGTKNMYKWAKEIPDLIVTYGTDLFFVPKEMGDEQVAMMERLLPWYSPGEILKMATGNAGYLYKMSGIRNPYPDGDLGVVKEGAYADLLLVEGNPLEDLSAVTETKNLLIIMKDGKIFKNTLK